MDLRALIDRFGAIASAASIAAFIGFLASLYLTEPIALSARTQVAAVSVVLFFAAYGWIIYIELKNKALYKSPKLLMVIGQGDVDIFLFERSDWISHRFQYSVFYVGDIEYYLGEGRILNIQEDRKIQLVMPPPTDNSRLTLYNRVKLEKVERTKVVIKPGSIADV